MSNLASLTIRFTGLWLSGTGTARGRHLDTVTYRDRDGCPAMPMSQVKGQLRETAERLAAGGHAGWAPPLVTRLFGSRPPPGQADPSGRSQAGLLSFEGDAGLPEPVRLALRGKDPVRAKLFRRMAGTMIGDAGVAEDKTLRAIEVAVPIEITGLITWTGPRAAEDDWITLLDSACAATLAFGKLKADGYGRAVARVETRRS